MPKKKSREEFIKEANNLHNNKYDYSNVDYTNSKTKVCIICPVHGKFFMTPSDHLRSHGCPSCAGLKKYTTDEFVNKAKKIHNNRYDYSKVKYVNNHTKICIICPEHGEYYQTPHDHLRGHGCPYCKSSLLENAVRKYLSDNNILFFEQKRFDWLGLQSLDFYLPSHKIAIECQGIQHFESVDFFGGKDGLIKTIYRDKKKKELCNKNGIIVLYYSNLNNIPFNVINNKNDLIKKVREYESKVKNTAQ